MPQEALRSKRLAVQEVLMFSMTPLECSGSSRVLCRSVVVLSKMLTASFPVAQHQETTEEDE